MFSLVISIESYFFWPNFEEDVKGIVRVMAPEGELIIGAEMYQHEGLSDFDQRVVEKFNLSLRTPEQFKKAYEEAGLTDINIVTDEEKGWIAAYGKKK